MSKAKHNLDLIEHCLNLNFSAGQKRQKVINQVALALLWQDCPEEEALSLFLWQLTHLEPPTTGSEALFFRALFSMLHNCGDIKIDTKEQALKILNIPEENWSLPPRELAKLARQAYWKSFNKLARNPQALYANARNLAWIKISLQYCLALQERDHQNKLE